MIVQIISTIAVLCFAFAQMLQGFYASIVMAICTVLSAGFAFASYKWVAEVTTLKSYQPNLAEPVCMALLFLVPLFEMRWITDKFFKGEIVFDKTVDRIGGAVFGLITATVLVGMLVVVFQMLPLGRDLLGTYAPYDTNLQRSQRLPLYTDDIVVALGQTFATGAMGTSAEKPVKDELLRTLYANRNTAGLGGRTDSPAEAFTVTAVCNEEDFFSKAPDNPLLNDNRNTTTLLLRVSLTSQAQDSDSWWRVPGTQLRLICFNPDKKIYRYYYPVDYLYFETSNQQIHLACEKNKRPSPADIIVARPAAEGIGDNLSIDWIYRIPKDETPTAVIFRNGTTVELPTPQKALPKAFQIDMLKLNPTAAAD